MKKISIILSLLVIAIGSIILKLYTVDFSIPAHYDDLRFILDAIQYNQGDFFLSQKKHPGWPLVLAPFISMIQSNNFLDYSNLARVLTLCISTISILPMYLLSRKFFDEKFSIVAASLFAFEPHLNYNAGAALSEPLLILVFILTVLCILNAKSKFHYLAFIFAGFCWWIRLEVIFPIIAVFIIYFLIYRKTSNFNKNLVLCSILLIIVVLPLFIQRDLQFEDPFYVWYSQTIFSDSYGEMLVHSEDAGVSDLVKNYGASGLIDRVAQGFVNLFTQLIQISYPYLIILLPFGVLFSLRPIGHKIKNIKANWITIITSIAILIIPFAIIDERRYLFPLFPFFIILATIPIYRVVTFGLSVFGFNDRQRSNFLIIVVILVLFLSILFTTGIAGFGYGQPNYVLEKERMQFTKYLVDNYDGGMLRDAETVDYLSVISLTSGSDSDFKEFKSPRGKDPFVVNYKPGDVVSIGVIGKNLPDLIINAESRNIKYIGIVESGSYFFPFLDDIYHNEKKYPFLKKIMDSTQMDYSELKMKIFEIDYEVFKSP